NIRPSASHAAQAGLVTAGSARIKSAVRFESAKWNEASSLSGERGESVASARLTHTVPINRMNNVTRTRIGPADEGRIAYRGLKGERVCVVHERACRQDAGSTLGLL